MEFTKLQQMVYDLAKAELETSDIYAVCIDNFPSDEDINKNGVVESVHKVVDETWYWEGIWIAPKNAQVSL
jgi:hypothetical protein